MGWCVRFGRNMPKQRRSQPEHHEQCAIFAWTRPLEHQYPRLKLLRSSFNPGKLSIGMRIKMSKEGARAGFPDLELSVARQGYHALFIEMKVGYNQLSAVQEEVNLALLMEGYQVLVCRSWKEAVTQIFEYLGDVEPRHYPKGVL